MFEITYDKQETMNDLVAAGKIYRDAVYDFVFEHRFLVYHVTHGGALRYIAYDLHTGLGSAVTDRKPEEPVSLDEYEDLIPQILFSIKYMGDTRYAQYRT